MSSLCTADHLAGQMAGSPREGTNYATSPFTGFPAAGGIRPVLQHGSPRRPRHEFPIFAVPASASATALRCFAATTRGFGVREG